MFKKLVVLLIPIAISLVVALVFTGCGGGGGGAVAPADDDNGTSSGVNVAHSNLTWDGSAGQCLQCHETEAEEMHGSIHYQWKGPAPLMNSGPSVQGKDAGAVNSYCINIKGNWAGCGKCHVGLGDTPTEVADVNQLANIDCLLCHQKDYTRKLSGGKWIPDLDAMTITLDVAVRTVSKPTKKDCLRCHAYAGGGDSVKRGDISAAHGNTADNNFDVHMSTSGENLNCTSCHITENHKISGKGSDLRATDSNLEVTCSNCHSDMASGQGHGDSDIDNHVSRVACQSCHIPHYAKNASDTVASEATETHRTWRSTHSTSAPFHPAADKQNNLVPKYLFYDGTSTCANLGEVSTIDPATGNYPTSRPAGSINGADSKLHPFKYKTAEQPRIDSTGEFLALDTSMYFATGDGDASARQGLSNMGLSPDLPYSWVITDTYQMLNHEVSPDSQALDCNSCHGSTSRMDLQGKLGYGLKESKETLCRDCHDYETASFTKVHEKHVDDKGYDCSRCHEFTRPERN